MQPPVPSPKSSKPEAPRSWRPTFRPFLSKRPGTVQISSLLPFAASLKPGRYQPVISVVPEAEPTRGVAPTAPAQAPAPRWRSVARLATLSAAALIIGGASFVAGKNWTGAPTSFVRRAGTPTLKPADDGGYVRWRNDAVDVVIDKSFSDLAGDDLFGAALDAWRASGASLPSVSTIPGEKRKVGYDPNGPNENVVVYAPQGWAKANGALAITVLTYDNATGHIVDADLLVNGGGRYFKRFEVDESSASDDPVNLESGGSSGSRKSSRYDIQSVVTHELGHFFGLGEDFAEAEGTMYVSTRPGETHKRVLKPSDTEAVTALYAAGFDASQGQSGGCGRSQLAPSAPSQSAWMGFAAALLGLGLLGASRRSARAEVPVRVASPRRARARKVARFGGWLTAVALAMFSSPTALEAAPDATARGEVDVEVLATSPHWADGVVETEVTYRVTACRAASCPEGDQRTVLAGGSLDGVTQVVGPFAVPQKGARLQLSLREPRGFYQILNPIFKP